ncbi:cilium assembly protein DZIP1L-like isoform X1 [Paramacrobiotus metropolitanus]|uniref:cilium assembly protein DZIP1L-like isoform X1 n=1 Tax=Paramacrobiotus metropolitanus TaxID=2943436 RepID=UPI002445F121|nr:cilium assembly protein DZIP1L-like isoform X1 [Paramacrobiotus metropolitanus]XP_055339649.1 cilium assembly protein DZIP1L-like isoform X1 [Paramacrobiotus metropolitanus]
MESPKPRPSDPSGAVPPRRPSSASGGPAQLPSAPHPSVHTVPLTLPYGSNGHTPSRLEHIDDHYSMIFRRKYERLDWRKLAALDLEKVYKSQDVRSLQENLTQLAFFDLEEELRSVEIHPQFVKLFQTMQLSLEYLLYVQDRLQRDLSTLSTSTTTLIEEKDTAISSLTTEVCQLRQTLDTSRDELKKRRKLMIAQQEIINSAAKGSYHKCPVCDKAFIERKYLETHFCRRHPNDDLSKYSASVPQSTNACRPEEQSVVLEKLQTLLQEVQRVAECRREDRTGTELTAQVEQRRDSQERTSVAMVRDERKSVMRDAACSEERKSGPPQQQRSSQNEQTIFGLPSGVAHLVVRESAQTSIGADTRDACVFDNDTESTPEPLLPKPSPPAQNLLELYGRQQAEVEHLRKSLTALQCHYAESEKALSELKSEWQKLVETRTKDTDDTVDTVHRRVTDLETKLRSSESAWQVRLNETHDEHQNSLTELERSWKKKAEDDDKAHKAEKLRLQMMNEEQEKRIQELEKRIAGFTERPAGGGLQVQQVQVHSRVRKNQGNLTPRLSAAVQAHPAMLTDLKSELERALDKKLAEYGIQKGTTTVSDRERDVIFGRLRDEHSQLQNKLAKYGAARSTIENHIRDRPPTEYSSTELLDAASKIRIRTRTGRQVIGDDKSQKITEITTYNITPMRSPDMSAERNQTTPKAASRKVHFDDSPQTAHSPPRLSAASEKTPDSEDHVIPTELSKPVSNTNNADDEAWFTDED